MGGFFGGEMKAISCPRYKRVVMYATEKETTPKSVQCRVCNKLVRYNPITQECKLTSIPPRTTASGMRLY